MPPFSFLVGGETPSPHLPTLVPAVDHLNQTLRALPHCARLLDLVAQVKTSNTFLKIAPHSPHFARPRSRLNLLRTDPSRPHLGTNLENSCRPAAQEIEDMLASVLYGPLDLDLYLFIPGTFNASVFNLSLQVVLAPGRLAIWPPPSTSSTFPSWRTCSFIHLESSLESFKFIGRINAASPLLSQILKFSEFGKEYKDIGAVAARLNKVESDQPVEAVTRS